MRDTRRNPGKATPAAGFTLFEALVALSLLALLSILFAGSFQFVLRSKGLDQRVRHGEQVLTASETLSNVLSTALPLGVPLPGGGQSKGLWGGADRVVFVAPGRHSMGGLFNYAIELAESATGGAGVLLLSSSAYHPGSPRPTVSSDRRKTVLLENVASLALRYYGKPLGARAARWSDTWEGPVLPLLVEIELTRSQAHANRHETIVVKLTQTQIWQ